MSGYCGACGHALTGGEQFCTACGTATAGRAPTPMITTQALPAVFGWSGAQAPGNAIPEWLLEKPNWGALLFGWWWTLWNGNARLKWIGFAMVVPINIMTVGMSQLGFSVYLCIYGNRIAAQCRRFDSVDHFRAVQNAWAAWGIGILIAAAVLSCVALVIGFLVGFAAAMGHG